MSVSPSLLGEKRKELGDAADKLRNGLFKIDETSVKVESMSVELEIAKGKGQDGDRDQLFSALN